IAAGSVIDLGVLTTMPFRETVVFRIYRETLSRFSCAASCGAHGGAGTGSAGGNGGTGGRAAVVAPAATVSVAASAAARAATARTAKSAVRAAPAAAGPTPVPAATAGKEVKAAAVVPVGRPGLAARWRR
ncbi:hypothetical protein ABLN68_13020, partial [Mycobacterium tuberculosis]